MKPLKHTTALAAYATSAFLFVPSAFAEEGAAVAQSGGNMAVTVGEPIAIAAASAIAVAALVKLKITDNKYKRLEADYCKFRMEMGFNGRIDESEFGQYFDDDRENARFAEDLPEIEQDGMDSSGVDEQVIVSNAASDSAVLDMETSNEGVEASEDNPDNSIVAAYGAADANDTAPTTGAVASDSDASQAGNSAARSHSANRNAVAQGTEAQAVQAAKSQTTDEVHSQIEIPVVSGGEHTYTPKHVRRAVQQGDSVTQSKMKPDDLLDSLESNFSDILSIPKHANDIDVTDPIEADAKYSNAVAQSVASGAEASGQDQKNKSAIDAKLPEIADNGASGTGAEAVAASNGGTGSAMKPSETFAQELDEAMPGRRVERSEQQVASDLEKRKSLGALSEVEAAGLAAGRATSQAALAAKSAAGNHAAVVVAPSDSERPIIPVRRGPGFVDVCDGTFVKGDGAARMRAAEAAEAEAMRNQGRSLVEDTGKQTALGQKVPSIAYARVNSTDSISDFPYSTLNKTYYTQGDMVRVEYPGQNNRTNGGDRQGETGKTFAELSGLSPVAVLASLPIV